MSQPAIQEAIHLLFSGQDLTEAQADAAMSEIMLGEATPAQIGAFLAALRIKGETVEEITGCAASMRRSAVPVKPNVGDTPLVDVVGTGGDGTQKFNISTITAFVLAGAGMRVAKHGNRSNRRAGSAADAEALGAALLLTPDQAAECIEEHRYRLPLRACPSPGHALSAIGPRREIAARTIFNILGPLTNPAPTTHQLIGVYAEELTCFHGAHAPEHGQQAAYVVYGYYETGAGLDELTTTGTSRITRLHNGEVTTLDFDPAESFGFERLPLADLQRYDQRGHRPLPYLKVS